MNSNNAGKSEIDNYINLQFTAKMSNLTVVLHATITVSAAAGGAVVGTSCLDGAGVG